MNNEVRTRVVTASVLVTVVVALLVAAQVSCVGRQAMAMVGILLTALCAFEFSWVVSHRSLALTFWGYLLVLLVPVAVVIAAMGSSVCVVNEIDSGVLTAPMEVSRAMLQALCLGGCVIVGLSMGWGRSDLARAQSISQELWPAFWLIGVGGASLTACAFLPHGPSLLSWLILVVSSNDIAAFFGGRRFQGPKLAPALSPGKTMSGSICGLLGGVCVGIGAVPLIGIPFTSAAVLACLVVFAAQQGDLLKSYLKRMHGVKDMGTLLPGHGGFVDRLDGLLLATPLALFFLPT